MAIPSLELLIGGVGLLLLGMTMLTDGLKLAAGGALHQVLERSTQTRLRGLLTGFAFTALVQSSSAVTVATLGFVNAGLLSLKQAAWLVMGSNVGTTVTGWLVSFIGLELKIEAVALPLIGIGVLLRIMRTSVRVSAAGSVISGLGLFFFGLSLLKTAFTDVGGSFSEIAVADVGIQGVLYAVLLGAAMTAVMQSSSAAIAMTITAYAQGVVGDTIGAALVIGANIGTTSTALLAAVGATANAKRLSVLHVIFNIQTAVVAGILLVPLLWLIQTTRALLGWTGDSAITLALFHTLFNVLGVALMLPLTATITTWLSSKFSARDTARFLPMYLDDSALSVPDTGVLAVERELCRVEDQVTLAVRELTSAEPLQNVTDSLEGIQALNDAIARFITRLNTASMQESTSQEVVDRMEINMQFQSALQALAELMGLLQASDSSGQPRPESILTALAASVIPTSETANMGARKRKAKALLKSLRESQRAAIVRTEPNTGADLRAVNLTLQMISAVSSFVSHWAKATNNLAKTHREESSEDLLEPRSGLAAGT